MFRVFVSGFLLLGLSLISESSFAQQTGCVVDDCANRKRTYYDDSSCTKVTSSTICSMVRRAISLRLWHIPK